jgi:hypothetical protein
MIYNKPNTKLHEVSGPILVANSMGVPPNYPIDHPFTFSFSMISQLIGDQHLWKPYIYSISMILWMVYMDVYGGYIHIIPYMEVS